MFRILLCFSVIFSLGHCQVVNRVRLIGHTDYILKIIRNVVLEVEDREWCNMKLPQITQVINETVIDEQYTGTVTYSKGFVTSIQHVDITQASVQQVWTFNNTDATGSVSLRGDLRMHDVVLGYDVEANLVEQGTHRYTAELRHNLLTFAFNMLYNLHRDEMSVTVTPTVPRNTNLMNFLPKDRITDVLTTVFDTALTADGITAWASDIFEPITYDVVTKVEFPRICYDCPVT